MRWHYKEIEKRKGVRYNDCRSVTNPPTKNRKVSLLGTGGRACSGDSTAGFYLCQLFLFFRAVEHTVHSVCRSLLCRVVEMCIDVCRGGEGTVTQPDLDLLHGDTVAEKQAGAGVPLRYNYDKPEKPRISRVVGLWQGFSSFSKPRNRAAK